MSGSGKSSSNSKSNFGKPRVLLLLCLLLACCVSAKKIDDSRCNAEFVEHGNDNGLHNVLLQLRVLVSVAALALA